MSTENGVDATDFPENPTRDRLTESLKRRKASLVAAQCAEEREAEGLDATQLRLQQGLDAACAADLMSGLPARPVVAGEIVPTERERLDEGGGWRIRNTLATPNAAAYAASLERTELLAGSRAATEVVALGIDAAASLDNPNPLETMLAHEMALAHKAAFRLMDEAFAQRDPVEMCRLANASARMMATYQQALVALQRVRSGGHQTLTVQYVSVNGGQTLVAAKVQNPGGASREGAAHEK